MANGRLRAQARRFIKRVRFNNDFSINGVIRAITTIVNRPLATLCIICALIITLTTVKEGTTVKSTVLESMYTKMATNTSVEPTAKWIKTNVAKTSGILWLVSGVLGGAPPSRQILYVVGVTLFTIYMEVAPIWEYISEAVLLLIFLKIRKSTSRMIIIFIAAMLYIGGYLFAHLK